MQSVHIYTDESKGRSEEVAKSPDVSLNHVDIFRSDWVITLLLGQTTDSGGGGVTKILASELKNVVRISFLCSIVNCCMHAQYKAMQKSVEQFYGAGGLGEVYFIQLFHTFWST